MVDLGKNIWKIPPTSSSFKGENKTYSKLSNEEGSGTFDNMLTAAFQENDLIWTGSVCFTVIQNYI